jgi:2-keto-4-pentenoate hydratase
MNAHEDSRVGSGMTAQFAQRRIRVEAGERPIGWKLGFGTSAALAKFALSGPLVGYMMEKSLLPSGATADLSGWIKPVAEPEIAIRIGADVPLADASSSNLQIEAYAPAIELADLHFPPEDVESILSHNIYHRYVVLGDFKAVPAGMDWSSLRATVQRGDTRTAVSGDVQANTGRVDEIVRHCAETLSIGGEQLRKGDVIILGSVVPPLFLAPEDTGVGFEIEGAGRVQIRLHPD